MDFEQFEELINFYSNKLNIKFNKKQLEQFYKYMKLLLEWNQKINLTAITDPKEIIIKHFIDSITISKYINQNENLLDVGTGAGFPGVPIKIIRPDVKITLLDSLNKRINFLNDVINQLKLENIYTVHSRIEEFGQNKKYREKFDNVTSRAVANLSVLSEYMIPLTKIGGKCICMKGNEIVEELEESKSSIKILGGKIRDIDEFKLPETDIGRNVIIIEKESKTPSKFPRKPGTPTKEPIK